MVRHRSVMNVKKEQYEILRMKKEMLRKKNIESSEKKLIEY